MARCRRESKRPVSHYPPSGPSLSFKAPLPYSNIVLMIKPLACGPLGNTIDLVGGDCKGRNISEPRLFVVPLDKFLRLCLTKDVACISYPCPHGQS